MRELARRVAEEHAASEWEATGEDVAWPARTMKALGRAGLLGLLVSPEDGGLGGGFSELAVACEELGRVNPSAGLVFGMHGVGAACIAARPTKEQRERFLQPIARGEHVVGVALSERDSGIHFYLPRLRAREDGSAFVLDGEKSFVTSAGYVDSYLVSTAPTNQDADAGRFDLVLVESAAPGLHVGPEWRGFGMRANSARSVIFDSTRVPAENVLGGRGEQAWYVFEVVAPYFLVAMAGTYLGVATRAVEEAAAHVREREHRPLGRALGDSAIIQHELADLWIRVEQARHFLDHAARLADAGEPSAPLALMGAKAALDSTVVDVTNGAMSLGGGQAFGENAVLATLLRDARACRVMSPTEGLLKSWIGRSILGLPMLSME